jgi:hypothetical protein
LNVIQAQIEQYNYVGVQTFESGEFTSYHLDFEFFQDNVQGRAIVDYGGPDETLYYIKGTYKNDILTFRAPFLVWTKSDLPQRDYCVLRFRESIKNLKTVKAFSGHYTSKRSQGEECSKGLLILSRMFQIEQAAPEEEEIVETSKPLQEQTEVSKPKTSITPKVNTPISQLRSTPIKKDENLNVFVTNKKVILVIYDAGKVDDDRISLTINGEEILTNYSIDSVKKEIEITLEKGKSVIEVTALNEGTSSPNTVKVEIKDGYKTISTRTSLKTGEKASLTILNN